MLIKRLPVIPTLKRLISLPDFLDEEQQTTGRLLTVFFDDHRFQNLNLLIVTLTSPERTIRPLFIILILIRSSSPCYCSSSLANSPDQLPVDWRDLAGSHRICLDWRRNACPSFTGYIVVTFLAGITLGGWGILVVAVISGASGLGMAYLESAGLLPAPEAMYTPYTFWLVEYTYLIILAFMQYYASQMTKASLQRARTELAERNKTEQVLVESENRFRALIKHSPVAICMTRELVVLYANLAYQKMFGLEMRTISAAFSPDQIAPRAVKSRKSRKANQACR
jgi:PAS domain-containing protein